MASRTPLLSGEVPSLQRLPSWTNVHARYSTYATLDDASDDADGRTKNQLGTFGGVYLPAIMSIFNVLMYIRFTWVVGCAGFYQTILIVALATGVSAITILSMSAICSNGAVKGGGVYFMLSRTLGPELGGAAGMLFYLAATVSGNLSILGMLSPLQQQYNFEFWGLSEHWMTFVLGSFILLFITVIALVGAEFFARFSTGLFVLSTLAIFFGLSGFFSASKGSLGYHNEVINGMNQTVPNFSGLSSATWDANWSPDYVVDVQTGEQTSFLYVFAVFYPCLTGILAGASLSGDLKDPGVAIPVGSLTALATAVFFYLMFFAFSAASVTRPISQTNFFVVQDLCFAGELIVYAVVLAGFQAGLSGMVGAARILQALARDELFPGLSIFSQGTKKGDEPVYAIIATWAITQLVLFITKINDLAPFITQVFLLTYGFVNLACFILRSVGVVNFRPTFKFYNRWVCLAGFFGCIFTMFAVDWRMALGSMGFFVLCSLLVFLRQIPNQWGEVLQALMYHQIRRMLLRLDMSREHVKYWRPSLMLLAPNAPHCLPLVKLANSLKKGGMYAICSVVIGDFKQVGPLCELNFKSWSRMLMASGIKAFATVVPAKSVLEGARGLLFSTGMGAMRPNIVMLGFPAKRTHETTLAFQRALESVRTSDSPSEPKADDVLSSSFPKKAPFFFKSQPDLEEESSDATADERKVEIVQGTPTARERLVVPQCFDNEEWAQLKNLFKQQEEYCGSLVDLHYMKLMRDALLCNKNVILGRNIHRFNFNHLTHKEVDKSWLSSCPLPFRMRRRTEEKNVCFELWVDVAKFLSDKPEAPSIEFGIQMAHILSVSQEWNHNTELRVVSFGSSEDAMPEKSISKFDDMHSQSDEKEHKGPNRQRLDRLKRMLADLRVSCPVSLVDVHLDDYKDTLRESIAATPHFPRRKGSVDSERFESSVSSAGPLDEQVQQDREDPLLQSVRQLPFLHRCNLLGKTISKPSSKKIETVLRIVTMPELPGEYVDLAPHAELPDSTHAQRLIEYLNGMSLLVQDDLPTLYMRGPVPVVSTSL